MEMKWKLEIENETKMVAKNVPIASGVSSSWTHEYVVWFVVTLAFYLAMVI